MKKYLAILVAIFGMASYAQAADVKISELDAATAVTSDDLFVITDSPASSPASKKVTLANILASGGTLAAGDIFYWDGTKITKLAKGTEAYVLKQGASAPEWTGTLSLSAIAMTGTIQGAIKISSDADGMTGAEMTTAGVYGTLFLATGAGTWTLPTAVSGMNLCLMDTGTAHDLILDVQAADTLMFNGTVDTAGDGITNASGSSTGDKICVVAYGAGTWIVTSSQGTWVAQ